MRRCLLVVLLSVAIFAQVLLSLRGSSAAASAFFASSTMAALANAQQQLAALNLRVAAAEASRDRARSEAASAWRQLAAEQEAHAATRAAASAASAAAAEALAAAEAGCRRRLHVSHLRELDNDIAHDGELDRLRRKHVAELSAAVAAAKTSERQRLQAAVGPGLLVLEETGRKLRRRLEAVEGEALDDRMFVWDRLGNMPPHVRQRFFS